MNDVVHATAAGILARSRRTAANASAIVLMRSIPRFARERKDPTPRVRHTQWLLAASSAAMGGREASRRYVTTRSVVTMRKTHPSTLRQFPDEPSHPDGLVEGIPSLPTPQHPPSVQYQQDTRHLLGKRFLAGGWHTAISSMDGTVRRSAPRLDGQRRMLDGVGVRASTAPYGNSISSKEKSSANSEEPWSSTIRLWT